ncbi:MAG: hypothetical protein Q8L95_00985 [Burkholderiales bacterium]|nr:hypothetical protein [Burkholderiales bacterium]
MSRKKSAKSKGNAQIVDAGRNDGDAAIRIPPEARRHLVAAAAYFRAARYRKVDAEGYRVDDKSAAEAELDELLKRYHVE